MERLEKRLLGLMRDLEPSIGDFSEIEELISKHGEYGVALEHICSILEEKKVAIDFQKQAEIIGIAKEMGFEKGAIRYYQEVFKKNQS
jgi:hypothetical protein